MPHTFTVGRVICPWCKQIQAKPVSVKGEWKFAISVCEDCEEEFFVEARIKTHCLNPVKEEEL